MIYLDLKGLAEQSGITEKDLLAMPLKEVVKLDKDIRDKKETDEAEARAVDETYKEYVRRFFRPMEYLKKWFSEDEIVAACAKFMKITDLAEETFVRGASENSGSRIGIFLRRERRKVAEYKGTWQRKVMADGAVFHTTNRYQNVHGMKEVLTFLLLARCPYLSEYKLDVYDISESDDWIYVEIGGESLYTPFSALMDKDAEKIVTTHLNYWHGYNSKLDEKNEAFIQSQPVQEFLAKVAA